MKKKQKDTTFSSLKKFAGSEQTKYVESIIFAVIGVASGFVPYFAVIQMIIELLNGGKELSFYLKWCGIATLGYIGKIIFSSISTSISHRATFITLMKIRKQLISKLSRMPMGNLLDTPSGEFKSIIVDRVEGLETTLAHLLPEMTSNILVPLLIVIYLFILDWRMALVSLITLPIGILCMMSMMKTYPVKYAESVETAKKMNNAVVEYVNGIEVIKAFNQSANSYEKYTNAVKNNASYFYNWMKSCQLEMSAYTTICPATLLTVLPIGFIFYNNGSLSSVDFITIIILSLSIAGPLIAATNFIDNLATVGTVINQVESILSGEELIRPSLPVNLNDSTIKLKNVTFCYHEDSKDAAVKNINIVIKPGTVTALVGPSGSGKSTIAKLIAGFWDVSEGEVSIGGFNIKSIPQSQLADKIAYVAQDNYLFNDTIRENIRMGRPTATDYEIEKAAKNAGCDEFIRGLENGYDTLVGGSGGHLSGGERQRIAIARAMLKDAPIVILDEATAYTDPENEALIQKSVSKLVVGKTLIVIAHRLSTITDSDQIIVMENGNICGKATHEELLKTSKLYQNMWQAHIGVKDGGIDD
ncbi:ABC transporter ATP-binding protein [Clostridium sp. CMCC3677]|uniref:ABC transporter ATP-binding protein n=1 Tax=Clostridium sp. CMCC3677 TaxID=2949963 RepID=UPI0013F05B40|nr:ABC transporter ATP-binding protein [Clostridium sp. CMCC3677]NFG61199.1 ABC transporter ATP-binding protein [Clostridium botulinum]NFQ08945.1 ABC transporter ATP-binding protein [Clostridium botulinum]